VSTICKRGHTASGATIRHELRGKEMKTSDARTKTHRCLQISDVIPAGWCLVLGNVQDVYNSQYYTANQNELTLMGPADS